MKLIVKIASRYLIAKKTTNAINIIAAVALTAITVISASLVILLSVMNGFEDLVSSLYNTFNPEFKVQPNKGKVFAPNKKQIQAISDIEGVLVVSQVLEENALVQYKERDQIARLKGVDEVYNFATQIDSAIIDGSFTLQQDSFNYAVIGVGVEGRLGININNRFARLKVFMPNRVGKVSRMRPETAFKQQNLYLSGVFAIQQEFDAKYVFVPLAFMHQLLDYENEISALEIAIRPDGNTTKIQQQIADIMGSDFTVKNRYQQDEVLYKIMRSEKLVMFLILTLVLAIAAFNIVGSLSMLVIEKKQDIAILKAMGADNNFIRNVFLSLGVLLGSSGAFIGLLIGFVVCSIQQYFGLIQIQGNSFLIDAYPVSMRFTDFILVLLTVFFISLLASFFPAYRAAATKAIEAK